MPRPLCHLARTLARTAIFLAGLSQAALSSGTLAAQGQGILRPAQLTDAATVPLALEHAIQGALPLALVPGRHAATVEGQVIGIDSTGDGELDRRIASRSPATVSVTVGNAAGGDAAVTRTLLVYHKLDSWYAAPAAVLKGTVAGHGIELLDADLDGRFDGEADHARFDKGSWFRQGSEKLVAGRKGPLRYELQKQGNDWTVKLTALGRPGEYRPALWEAMTHLNRWRNEVGLAPLRLNANYCGGCQKHADYLRRHEADYEANPGADGLAVHDEDPKREGYSKEGQDAARWSNITHIADPLAAIDMQTPTMLHRVWFLAAPGSGLGVGISGDPRAKKPEGWTVIRTGQSLVQRTEDIVVVPAPGQTRVPLLAKPEFPLPQDDPGCYLRKPGYPVSVTFGTLKLTDVKVELFRGRDAGGKVRGTLYTPENPIHKSLPNNNLTAFFLPKYSLRRGSTYTAVFTAKLADKPVRLVWTFKT